MQDVIYFGRGHFQMKKISTKVLIPVVLLAVIAVISAVTGLKNANELHTSSKGDQ